MKKIFKRVSAAVVALAVMFTAVFVFEVPKTEASADEHANHDGWTEFTASTGNISSSGNYYLNGNVELTNTITISGSDTVVNLCLNGQTVTNRGREVFELSGGATLNIYDCGGVGKIESSNLFGGSAVEIGESCKLNLYSGIITTVANKMGFVIKNFGSLTISGGVISATDNVSSQPQAIIECDSNSSVTMTGGEISGDAGNGIQSQYGSSNVTVNISGGTIACWYTCIDASMGDSVVTISGGTIKSTDTKNSSSPSWESIKNSGTMTITGGNFDSGILRGFINKKTLKISGGTFKTSNSMLCSNSGELTISGGTFEKTGTGNCYFDIGGTLNLQSEPTFNGAYIKLGSGKTITVAGELTYTTPCAVSAATVPGNFTSGWKAQMDGKDITRYFKSYKSNVNLTERDGEGYLHYYTVTFDANGGNCATSSSETNSYKKLGSLPVPTKNNCDFGGWFTAQTGGEQITTDTVFSGDTTVYAHWTNNCSHNYSNEWKYDGTNHWYECSNCGDKKDTATHSYGDWTLISNPTLTETGTAKRTCSICGYEQTESVPALTDTNVWTKDENKHIDPTEEAEGKDVYHSDEFGDVTAVIPELDHVHNNLTFVPEVPATETTEGVKEHWECRCGEKYLDKDGKQPATADDLRIGKIQKEVQASENVPKPEIATSGEALINAALTEEDKNKVQQGKNIKIILKVEDATENAPENDKTAVTGEIDKMSRYKLGQYLDVTLLKQIGEEQQKITTTNAPIKITFEIPSALRGNPEYSVIRIHDGVATVLDDLDSDPNTVTIETDKFSTYALTYQEKTATSNPSGGSSGISRPRPSTSTPTESDNSDTTSSDDNLSKEDSSDTTSGESKPTEADNSDTTSSDDGNTTSSEDSNTTSSGENSVSSEDNTGNHDGNPSTGFAVSLIPLTAALVAITAAAKRKKK